MAQPANRPNRPESRDASDAEPQPAETVAALYGNRLRVRVCGLYREDDCLLMVRHQGLGPSSTFWSPPGGGVQFGETAPAALTREFAEETGLDVAVGDLLCVHEFLEMPLHAVELFFSVKKMGGTMTLGTDPEMGPDDQLIKEVRFMSFAEIKQLPAEEVHTVVSNCDSIEALFRKRGYLRD